jgi:hypothetical protein
MGGMSVRKNLVYGKMSSEKDALLPLPAGCWENILKHTIRHSHGLLPFWG